MCLPLNFHCTADSRADARLRAECGADCAGNNNFEKYPGY